MTLVPSRRTSTVSVWNRNSCGSRTAWLRPVQNTFARLVFIVTQASVIHTNDTYHRGECPADPFGNLGAERCKAVAPPYRRLGQSSRGTIGSRRFHLLRKAAYRSDGSMLLTMRVHSACPLPIPKCRSAVVTTLPAPPSALPLVYSDISNCQPMAVTTVVGNLDGGILATAVRAREWNDGGAIRRNRAPATTFEVVDSDEIGDVHGRSRLARRSSVSAGGGAEEQIEAVHPDFDEAL